MSYDLFFAARTAGPFDPTLVEAVVLGRPNWRRTPSETPRWWYENAATGVYGSLAIDDDAGEIASADHLVPLAANLNYARPSFFGHEFLPEIAAIAAALDLLVIDTQDELFDIQPRPRPAVPTELIESWVRHNDLVVATLTRDHKEVSLPVMRRADSLAAWRYRSHHDRIQEQLGDSIYASELAFARPKRGRRAVRYSEWFEGLPSLLPDSDLVLLVDTAKAGDPDVRGFVTRDELLSALGDTVTRVPLDIADLPPQAVIAPERSAAATARAARLKLTPFSEFAEVASDKFVDEPDRVVSSEARRPR